ncbi:hypothetical protein EOD39_19808 [Acipenser ruthenus]|uniref:Uncharacterized protein n=1 Tax=Acipenser ruthenus TaxID=7906 RepID=A0A444UX52_ACIRT|nr:hypothetical protein EOD39_19808 [Acipenser ruthenus]
MGLQRPLDICSNCGFLISSPVLQGPGPAEKDGVVLSEGRENSALMTDQGPGPAEKDGVVLSEGRENSALMTDQVKAEKREVGITCHLMRLKRKTPGSSSVKVFVGRNVNPGDVFILQTYTLPSVTEDTE